MKDKRPNILMYLTVGILLKLFALFNGQKILNKVRIKGPAITLSNHTSWYDFAYTFAAIYPSRTTFLAAEKMFKDPKMGFWLKLARAIPKKLFRPDPQAVFAILRLLKRKEIVSIFPEGQISTTGQPIPINFAIAKLIKKAGVDVYGVTHLNACLVKPAWAKKSFKGKTITTIETILSKEAVLQSSEQDIYDLIVKKLAINSNRINQDIKFRFKVKNISGLNNIIYQCHQCPREGLVVKKDQLVCPYCSSTRTYDYYGLLSGKTIHEIYFQQKNTLNTLLKENPDYTLESEAVLESYDHDLIKPLGNGVITLSVKGYHYQGYFRGKKVDIIIPIKDVPALPGDLGENIQIYYQNEFYQFKLPTNYLPTKFILFSELLYEKVTGKKLGDVF